MFTGKPLPPMHPLLENAGFAEGMVSWCRQWALCFGADRGTPVATRPVVTLRRDGSRALVLPCTSQVRDGDPSRRELVSPRDVMWVIADVRRRRTFAFRRYEMVGLDALGPKFGVMNHGARIDLMNWVKERY
jgi:hypothetical protein